MRTLAETPQKSAASLRSERGPSSRAECEHPKRAAPSSATAPHAPTSRAAPHAPTSRAARYEALRESIVRLSQVPERADERVPLGIPALDLALDGGLSRRGVHEWIGVGDRPGLRLPPMGALLHVAQRALDREAPDRRRCAVWIGRACHPPERALVRGLRGVVNGRRPVPDPALLERSILVDAETPQERAWAIEQAARCPGVFLVVGDGAGFDSALSRRVQLAAQGCSLVLVSRLDRERSALSVAMTRWLVLPQSCGAGEAGRVAAWIDGASPGSAPPVEWPPPARWRVILLRSKQASAASTAQDHGPVGADSKSPPGPIGTATKRGQ